MPWTFYNSSGEALTSFGPVALTDLDIDGGTAIGEAVVGADLFIMDNGAGGTNVKVTATEVATFIAAPAQANQTAIEAETNQDTYVPPDLIRHSPGVAKLWGEWNVGGAMTSNFNIASITDTGVGDHTVVIATDMSLNTYAAIVTAYEDDELLAMSIHSRVAASFRIVVRNDGDTLTDPDAYQCVAFGDQ